jgi:hypothetical protein
MKTESTSISRRQALALAAALTLAVGTAVAAVGGIAHTPTAAAPAAAVFAPVAQTAVPAREADD